MALFSLDEFPDVDGVIALNRRVGQMRQDPGVTWEIVNAMGYATPSRGDLDFGDSPLYRMTLVRPYFSGLSPQLEPEFHAEIFQRLEEAGGRLIIGCKCAEEQWSAFFLEAWPSFDAIMKHVTSMRDLMRRYQVVWDTESYIGVKT